MHYQSAPLKSKQLGSTAAPARPALAQNPSPIVVYCQSAQCNSSHQIAGQLREHLPEAEIYTLQGAWSPIK